MSNSGRTINRLGDQIQTQPAPSSGGGLTEGVYTNATVTVDVDGNISNVETGRGSSPKVLGGSHFSGNTYLHRDSFTCTNGNAITCSFWYYDDASVRGGSDNYPLLQFDEPNFDQPNIYFRGAPSERWLQTNWRSGTKSITIETDSPSLPQKRWCHVVFSFDLVTERAACYINRVKQVGAFTIGAGTIATLPMNGKQFDFCGDPDSFTRDFFFGGIAQFFLKIGTSIAEADDSITEENLLKFITADQKPVSLGTDGSTPFGTQPEIFFEREPLDAVDDFGTNKGSGGATSIVGDDLFAIPGPCEINPQFVIQDRSNSVVARADENIAVGDLVSLSFVTTVAHCVKADATDTTLPAHGFAERAATTPNRVLVYLPINPNANTNGGSSGLGFVAGQPYYLDPANPGHAVQTAPVTSGNGSQIVGTMRDDNVLMFNPQAMTEVP